MRDDFVTSVAPAGGRAALPSALAAVALLASTPTAQAQQLLTLVRGVGEAASVGDPGPSIGPVPTAVQVDLELLRAAPARLEVPTPDGSVLSAERSVFEDRGGGDLMWSGGQPGAEYDTVVLTVEGGRLVGRFGSTSGGVYQIDAERDGRGGMAPIIGLRPDDESRLCAVEIGEEAGYDPHAHVRAGALAAVPPERVDNPQSHDRLDILVAYTATAAEHWADRGGALAAIRHAGDYLKMVFRNNNLPVEPHIVHIAQASATLDRAERDAGWHEVESLERQIRRDGDLLRLRHEHGADFVHLFMGEPARLLGFAPCGVHYQRSKGTTAEGFFPYAFGWTRYDREGCQDYAVTFVHEIAHGLGAHHDPDNVQRPERLIRPYAFGHVNYDVMPSLGTAMSYNGQIEPFFSTPRIRPHGTVLGVADEQDNERVLQETVHIGVRYSDYLRSLEGAPAPPSDLRVRFEGGSASLSWQDNAPDADGYEVNYRWWVSRQSSFARRQAVEGRSEAALPLEGTEPGRRYDFWVTARKGEARSLRSSIVRLVFPGEPIAAPSEVSATVRSRLSGVDVRWTDNSGNESGFDVQLLQDGEPIARNRVEADSERSGFDAWWVRPQGGAEYAVRVFAYNSSGYSESSELATFRWTQPAAPGPVTDVAASAIGPTTVRLTWVGNSQSDHYFVTAWLRNWEQTGFLASAGTGWVDFDGLARGGRYTFNVRPLEDGSHGGAIRDGVFGSHAYLTLGDRGAGPRAPSDLSWATTDDGTRLSWKDNSHDELGFEVQYRSDHGWEHGNWTRLLIAPADTESAIVESGELEHRNLRVFAYNERGFSASSPRVAGLPAVGFVTATAGDAEVCLGWNVKPVQRATGVQVRWKPTAELPFDERVDAWMNLPASARAYTVTGLVNGEEYTFAVRAMMASGATLARTATETPHAGAPETPSIENFIARVGDYEIGLTWQVNGAETATGIQLRFKATAELPFDDAVDAWTDLPAPARAYTATGLKRGTEYTFTARALRGSCTGAAVITTATLPVAPPAPPTAAFRLDIPCDEELCRTLTDTLVSFVDTSTGNVTERQWSFGDGTMSDLKSPTHAWSTPGSYTVMLRVSDGSSSDSATRTVLVSAPPRAPLKASFLVDTPCEEDLCRTLTDAPVSFVDTSSGNVTEWRWSFGDGATSNLRSPTHAWSTPGFYDVTLTVNDGSSSDSATRTVLVEAAEPAGSCRFDDETLCLRDSRFEVKADWWSADGESGPGRVVDAGTNDSGLFRFFAPLNWEIVIKVLDGCGINGRMWVLGAATTDLGYRIRVTDTVTGESRSYENEPGQPAPAIVDTEAFSLPCGGAGP
ncbi:MAG: fibronectin type III domain-containing protein [Acidobacteria bacterium]|nr:fibronectin type III domain-containing protein [Acidobacteriota bacterium]